MWFKKKNNQQLKTEQFSKTINLSSIAKLSYISIDIFLSPYYDKDAFSAEVVYYERPENRYGDRGAGHEKKMIAESWPELRDKIDKLLGV